MTSLLLIFLACATKSDCDLACDALYGACGDYSISQMGPTMAGKPDAALSACYDECAAATEQHQDEWSACVLDLDVTEYDPADGATCLNALNECDFSPCENGERFMWGTPHQDWTCEP